MKQRIVWIDFARTVAIIAIVANHAISRVFMNYADQYVEFANQDLYSQVFKSIVTTFSWLGVPLFLMITGALILNKSFETEEDIKYFYQHNWIRLVIATIIWGIIGYIYRTLVLYPTNHFLLNEWCIGLIQNVFYINKNEFGSFWYTNMLVFIYTLLPVINVYLKKFTCRSLLMPLFLIFVAGIFIPTINKYLVMADLPTYSFSLLSNVRFQTFQMSEFLALLYVVIGYMINNGALYQLGTKKNAIYFILFFTVTCFLQLYGYSHTYDFVTGYNSIGICISSILLFNYIRQRANSISRKDIFERIAIRAFGIYEIHIIVLETIFKYTQWNILFINHVTTASLFIIVPMIISWLIILLLERSKKLREYMLFE